MIKIYRTDDQFIHEEETIQEGVWIQMIQPTREEAMRVAEELDIDIDDQAVSVFFSDLSADQPVCAGSGAQDLWKTYQCRI